MRTPSEWADYCEKECRGGYVPEGNARILYESGQTLARLLKDWDVWKSHDVLVDVGCGNGRLAMGLIGQGVNYHGLDVIPWSIAFCRKAFAEYHRFAFYHLDVKNSAYYPQGKMDPEKAVYPLVDNFADVIVANSLFTHTETLQVAARNLKEMYRVLRMGGKLFSTWRLVPPLDAVDNAARHTNYRREDVLQLLKDHRFNITSEIDGLPREIPVSKEQIGFLAVKVA